MNNGNSGPKIRSPRVAQAINRAIRELGYADGMDFIRAYQQAYRTGARNHLYKLLNGTTFVGEDGTLPRICKLLKLNPDDMIHLLHKDKIEDKEWAHAVPKADRTVQEIAAIMDGLKPGDREDILKYAKMRAGLL